MIFTNLVWPSKTFLYARTYMHIQYSAVYACDDLLPNTTHAHMLYAPAKGGDESAPLEDGDSAAGDSQPQLHTMMVLRLEQLHSIEIQPAVDKGHST